MFRLRHDMFYFSDASDMNGGKKVLTWVGVIAVSITFLVSASLLYPSITNPVIGMIIGLPLIVWLSYVLVNKFDSFSFILVIFICNHFKFYDNLWNLIFLGAFLFLNPSRLLKVKGQGSIFMLLIKGLFLLNCLGLILNGTDSLSGNVLSFTIFCSYFLIFYLLLNYDLKTYDLERLIKVICFIIFFQLVVCLIQKLGILNIDLPFLPLALVYDDSVGELSLSRVSGTFGDFELLAEYSAFFFVFFACMLVYKKADRFFNKTVLIAILISLFILILLTGTRSSLILVCAGGLILFLTNLKVLLSFRFWLASAIIYFGFMFMLRSGDPLGLKLSFDRLQEIDMSNGVQTSDEALNRDLTFDFAYKRLEEKPWIIGTGYATGEGYRKSLFGDNATLTDIRDYHSLYLSMPVFFGWAGTFVLIFLFIVSLASYAKNLFVLPNNSLAFYISVGFLLTWLLLFINEYKIQFIRYPNYFFLIWFWMAISINISKKLRNEDHYFG